MKKLTLILICLPLLFTTCKKEEEEEEEEEEQVEDSPFTGLWSGHYYIEDGTILVGSFNFNVDLYGNIDGNFVVDPINGEPASPADNLMRGSVSNTGLLSTEAGFIYENNNTFNIMNLTGQLEISTLTDCNTEDEIVVGVGWGTYDNSYLGSEGDWQCYNDKHPDYLYIQ